MTFPYFEHLINNRVFTTVKTVVDEELTLNPSKNYLFDLSYLDVLAVEGEKAFDFLQGQLTCDMRLVSDIQMIQGAQCNLKGRILALMDVISWHGIKLILPKDLIEPSINSLTKTAMLSRVSLKKEANLMVFGFYLQNPEDSVPNTSFFPNTLYAQTYNDQFCCYHLGNNFYIFLASSEFRNDVFQLFQEKDQLLGSLAWHTFRLNYGQLDIYPESRGLFLPHRLDLHQTQYISFNKGCYKGQEIIARMHYKATIKHQMKRYTLKTDQKIYSGQKLYKVTEGAEIGELVDFSLLGQGRYLIVASILKEPVSTVQFDGHLDPVELVPCLVNSFSNV